MEIAIIGLAIVGAVSCVAMLVIVVGNIVTFRRKQDYQKRLSELRDYLTEKYPGLIDVIREYDVEGLLGLATLIHVSLEFHDRFDGDMRAMAITQLKANGIHLGEQARNDFLGASWDDLRHISKLITPP